MTQQLSMMKLAPWSVLTAVCMVLGSAHPGIAQSVLIEQANTVRELNGQRPVIDATAVATDATPSAAGFTIPSLWWQQRQQGEAIKSFRLIDSWRAYEDPMQPHHVDVVVNGQIWPLLSYLQQYAFITQFGESAKSYGYQLRIFTGERLIGLHVCDFADGINRQTNNATEIDVRPALSPQCLVELDYFGQGAIRGGGQR